MSRQSSIIQPISESSTPQSHAAQSSLASYPSSELPTYCCESVLERATPYGAYNSYIVLSGNNTGVAFLAILNPYVSPFVFFIRFPVCGSTFLHIDMSTVI